MTYKSILVHVEPTDAGRERLRAAVELARLFGARLTGLGARVLNPMPDPIGLSVIKGKEEVEAALAHAEAMFKEEAAALGDAPSLWQTEPNFPTQALLRHACGADLLIADRGVKDVTPETEASTDDLIMSGGLPVLMIPTGAKLDIAKIVIGWKNTREARRAVWDALPLLVRAQSVHLLHLSSGGEAPAPEMQEVMERLRLHGARAELTVIESSESSLADDMLKAATTIGSGLIVVGGYGHSRLREWALGGMTRGLLGQSLKCVLFSH
jgi:nucleotide-binding universal stress UspA family protein